MAQEQGISWIVQTHEHKERSADWYWALGLIAVAGAVLSIFLGNALFAVILLVGAASLGILMARGPREHWVNLGPLGITLDGTLYRYRNLHSFWVDEARGVLLISTTGLVHPQLVVPLESAARAGAVRGYLAKYAKEEEQEAHLGEHLAELFGL